MGTETVVRARPRVTARRTRWRSGPVGVTADVGADGTARSPICRSTLRTYATNVEASELTSISSTAESVTNDSRG